MQQLKYDYLFISGHFAILARASERDYIGHPYSGSLVGTARSLPEALRIANSIMQHANLKYEYGLRVSDAAVEKQRAIDEQKRIQFA